MPNEFEKSFQRGKCMFIERVPNIVSAGLPSVQQNESLGDSLKRYLLQDAVDALTGDALIPTDEQDQHPPSRKPIPEDQRHAGPYGKVAQLINLPLKTTFQTLVDDFKETSYKSYWKKPVGRVPDPVPMFPGGYDIVGTTYGKPTPFHGRLYEIVMPKDHLPTHTSSSKEAGAQVNRKYCSPPYSSSLTFGCRTHVDKSGIYARSCLTGPGTGSRAIVNTQSNYLDAKHGLGSVLALKENIVKAPNEYSNNLPGCLKFCEINKDLYILRKCLKQLNTLRIVLSSRYSPTFFYNFYLTLKYEDKQKTGWLAKDVVYKHCGMKLIRFDPAMMEPLLSMWKAFDGYQIEYKIFVRVINYREPSPELPKIFDIPPECLDYSTTYAEMVKRSQPSDNRRRAGLPSGRYLEFDYPFITERYSEADKICLPEESDVRSCIAPSVLTQLFVNHRDMYEKQEPDVIRKVFEAAGEKFSDQSFEIIWKEAQKFHSQGWVCYETFRRAMEKSAYMLSENVTKNITSEAVIS